MDSNTETDQPTLANIRRHNGVAGTFCYNVDVTYPGEHTRPVMFIGSVYGASIVLATPEKPHGMFVRDPSRFGPELDPEWVRKFFA